MLKCQTYIFLATLFMFQCRPKQVNIQTLFPGKPEVPASIMKEHEQLLNAVHSLTLTDDSAGRAATKLHQLMQHHFDEEEDFALPQLGLLPLLAGGELPAEKTEVQKLADKLRSNLIHLDVEHQLIIAYTKELKQVTPRENIPAIIELEKELHRHATAEEEILFPAAILVGEYLRLKSN